MNEPAWQTSPAAPFALPHPPAEPCKAGIPAGKGPVRPGGDGRVRTAGFVKWQPGIQPFKRLSRREPEKRSCASLVSAQNADPQENRTSDLR